MGIQSHSERDRAHLAPSQDEDLRIANRLLRIEKMVCLPVGAMVLEVEEVILPKAATRREEAMVHEGHHHGDMGEADIQPVGEVVIHLLAR